MLWCIVVLPGTTVAFCYYSRYYSRYQSEERTDRENNTKRTAEKGNESPNLKLMPEADLPLNSSVK